MQEQPCRKSGSGVEDWTSRRSRSPVHAAIPTRSSVTTFTFVSSSTHTAKDHRALDAFSPRVPVYVTSTARRKYSPLVLIVEARDTQVRAFLLSSTPRDCLGVTVSTAFMTADSGGPLSLLSSLHQIKLFTAKPGQDHRICGRPAHSFRASDDGEYGVNRQYCFSARQTQTPTSATSLGRQFDWWMLGSAFASIGGLHCLANACRVD